MQDSEEDEDGNTPQHCLVSGATRRELAGWRHRRISQSKAKEIFSMSKYHLSDLPFESVKTIPPSWPPACLHRMRACS